MDITKAIAIIIVMIVPAFVGAAICWAVLPSWFTVLCWLAFMIWLSKKIIAGELVADFRYLMSGIKNRFRNKEKE